jgi:hypothetical protein
MRSMMHLPCVSWDRCVLAPPLACGSTEAIGTGKVSSRQSSVLGLQCLLMPSPVTASCCSQRPKTRRVAIPTTSGGISLAISNVKVTHHISDMQKSRALLRTMPKQPAAHACRSMMDMCLSCIVHMPRCSKASQRHMVPFAGFRHRLVPHTLCSRCHSSQRRCCRPPPPSEPSSCSVICCGIRR